MSLSLPRDYPRLATVGSFEALLRTPMQNGVNALCWPRTLEADFESVVSALVNSPEGIDSGITSLDTERLQSLSLPPAGRRAVALMLGDLQCLRDQGLSPELNCIRAYPREEEPGAVPIDVYSYHADSAPIEADTWLCTYFGAPSEALRNEEAVQRIAVPDTRAALLREYGGVEDEGFEEYLREGCFDLHYAPLPGALPFSFGVGNLWRIATAWPGSPVPPCVHRAPDQKAGELPRLLLIS